MGEESQSNSVAVVTGGASGIGLACARRLGGHRELVLVDMSADRLAMAAAKLRATGLKVTPIAVDITDSASVARLADSVRSLGRLSALVNAAGLSPTMASGRRIIEVNLIGAALIERAFLQLAEPGSVAVLIASTAGHMSASAQSLDTLLTKPLAEGFLDSVGADAEKPEIAYSISKRGVMLYCEAAAPDWGARGGRIVTISPGMIDTPMGQLEFAGQPLMKQMLDMTPIKRWGRPDDIAAAVEFLVSPEASFITGTDLRIDGGITPLFKHRVA